MVLWPTGVGPTADSAVNYLTAETPAAFVIPAPGLEKARFVHETQREGDSDSAYLAFLSILVG